MICICFSKTGGFVGYAPSNKNLIYAAKNQLGQTVLTLKERVPEPLGFCQPDFMSLKLGLRNTDWLGESVEAMRLGVQFLVKN